MMFANSPLDQYIGLNPSTLLPRPHHPVVMPFFGYLVDSTKAMPFGSTMLAVRY